MWIINTGRPESTTGECVSAVREKWEKSSIWDEFAAATTAISQSIMSNDHDSLRSGIKNNHSLLEQIGVVPKKVSSFITALTKQSGAAKISGAGSIRGDTAGIILAMTQEAPFALCDTYGFSCFPLRGEALGTEVNYC
jgi:mevalonate kinase